MRATGIIFTICFSIGVILVIITGFKPAIKTEIHNTSFELPTVDTYQSQLKLAKDLENKPVPTNKWFTGNLGEKENPIYPLPYSILLSTNKIVYSLPQKTISTYSISQNFSNDFTINLPAGCEYSLEYFDDLIARYIFFNETLSFKLTLQRGNPLIYITGENLELSIGNIESKNEDFLFTDNSGRMIFAATATNVPIYNADSKSINLKDKYIAIGSIPEASHYSNYLDIYKNLPLSSKVTFLYSENNELILQYNVVTENDNETFIGLLPHHKKFLNTIFPGFNINTIRGDMLIGKGNQFTCLLPLVFTEAVEDISHLSAEKLQKLSLLFDQDFKNISINSTSIYFIGKELFRLANMLETAKALDSQFGGKRFESISKILKDELSDWFTFTEGEENKYFAYDSNRKGVLGIKPDFGSENYNDHHFHFGYFIYAYSKLAYYDEAFKKKYQSTVEYLIKDIANFSNESSEFPYLRYFDLYEWHSWANGLDQFADGNNQESVSEAINAWYGIYQYSNIWEDLALKNNSLALYSMEIEAAKFYWWNFYQDASIFPLKFEPSFISLLWQGKAEQATFFSNDLEAKLGIIIIPVSEGSFYLKNNPNAVAINNYFNQNKSSSRFLEDQIIFWQLLNNLVNINELDLSAIKTDSSTSLSFLQRLFWLYALKN